MVFARLNVHKIVVFAWLNVHKNVKSLRVPFIFSNFADRRIKIKENEKEDIPKITGMEE